MRLALILLLGWSLPLVAAEPKAYLTGPASATTNTDILFRFTGTVTDADVELEMAEGPEPIVPVLLYTKQGVPIYGSAHPTKPGTYMFALVATGTVAGSTTPIRSYAFVQVVVTVPTPPPNPVPPPPDPTPDPIAYTGKLWSVLVLPETLTPSLAQLRVNPKIRSELAARTVEWRSYIQSEAEMGGDGWKAQIAKAGGTPVVLWLDAESKVLATSKPDETSIIAAAQKIRGK